MVRWCLGLWCEPEEDCLNSNCHWLRFRSRLMDQTLVMFPFWVEVGLAWNPYRVLRGRIDWACCWVLSQLGQDELVNGELPPVVLLVLCRFLCDLCLQVKMGGNWARALGLCWVLCLCVGTAAFCLKWTILENSRDNIPRVLIKQVYYAFSQCGAQ